MLRSPQHQIAAVITNHSWSKAHRQNLSQVPTLGLSPSPRKCSCFHQVLGPSLDLGLVQPNQHGRHALTLLLHTRGGGGIQARISAIQTLYEIFVCNFLACLRICAGRR